MTNKTIQARLRHAQEGCENSKDETWRNISSLFGEAADEIARLTLDVERLEKNMGHWQTEGRRAEDGWELCREKADALAEAADGLFKIIDEAGLGYLARGLGVKSEPSFGRANDCMAKVKAAITAYQGKGK